VPPDGTLGSLPSAMRRSRSLGDDDFAAVYRAWLDANVLVIRGQEVDIDQYLQQHRSHHANGDDHPLAGRQRMNGGKGRGHRPAP